MENKTNEIMSIKNISLNFHDYVDSKDFATQMENYYDENHWELPAGEDFEEYFLYNTAK